MITYLLKKTDYRTERRPYGYPYRGRMDTLGTAIDRYELNFHDSGNVQFRSTAMIYGEATSGKKFSRWQVISSTNFRRSAITGRPVVTTRNNRNKYYGGIVGIQAFVSHINNFYREYGDVVASMSPEHSKILGDIRGELTNPPMRHLYGGLDLAQIVGPSGTYPWLYFATPADAAVELFGKTRYRKDLVKTIGQTNVDALAVSHAFRGLVPIDWLINLMRDHEGKEPVNFATDYRYLRPILKKMGQRELRRLLNDFGDPNYDNGRPPVRNMRARRMISDVSRYASQFSVEEINFEGVRSWNDVHDRVWRNYRPRVQPAVYATPKPPEVHKIKPVQMAKDIHAAFEGSEYVHVMPEDSNTLAEWSDTMGNCIRGYGYQASKGSCVLGAIYKGDKMLANYEVTKSGRLSQLLGKYNKTLDTADHDVVVSLLQKAGVDTNTEYWGKPNRVDQYTGNW